MIEDTLRAKGLNYQIYGGLKFYDRLEVKDALAYLKVLMNPADDVSFRRIVNVPSRGIGAVSLERFSKTARLQGMSHLGLLEAVFGTDPSVNLEVGRSKKNFQKFFKLMASLKNSKENLLPSDLLNFVLEESGYKQALMDEKTVEAQSRLENLAELKQSIVEYELRCGADRLNEPITLDGFLEQVALVSDIDRFDPDAPFLKMMTIHMAKGLEFNHVFVVGLEEELFPNIRSWEAEETSDVEEERRLFYVGMTRARQSLSLFFAKNRTVFGSAQFRVMSRFLEEVPEQYVKWKKADYFSRRRSYRDRPGLPPKGRAFDDYEFDQSPQVEDEGYDSEFGEDGDEMRAGRRVLHLIFGEGVVRKALSDKLLVEFRGRGLKKISRKFSQLKAL